MTSIVVTEGHWNALLDHFRARSDERMGFAFAGTSSEGESHDFLGRDIDLPPDHEYRHQSRFGIALSVENVLPRVVKAKGHTAFIDMHSHPFSTRPVPSSTDDAGAVVQRRVLRHLAPGVQLVRLVFGRGANVWAEVADPNSDGWYSIDRIVVLGLTRRSVVIPVNSGMERITHLAPEDGRTSAVIGAEAVDAVRDMNVLVIGAGGTGSATIAMLRGYIDRLAIVDPDIVEVHNAPRLYHYGRGDIGQPKVDMHSREIGRAFPGCRVRTLQTSFPDEASMNLFKDADVIFCCPDHNAVRYAAATAAARYMKPLIEIGCGGKRTAGRVSALGYHVRLQVPGAPCLACNGLDLTELEDPTSSAMKERIGYVTGGDLIGGELMPLTSRAAADAVDIFFRYATGYAPCARHLYFDALRLQMMNLSAAYESMRQCTLCGDTSIAGAGDQVGLEHAIMNSADSGIPEGAEG